MKSEAVQLNGIWYIKDEYEYRMIYSTRENETILEENISWKKHTKKWTYFRKMAKLLSVTNIFTNTKKEQNEKYYMLSDNSLQLNLNFFIYCVSFVCSRIIINNSYSSVKWSCDFFIFYIFLKWTLWKEVIEKIKWNKVKKNIILLNRKKYWSSCLSSFLFSERITGQIRYKKISKCWWYIYLFTNLIVKLCKGKYNFSIELGI